MKPTLLLFLSCWLGMYTAYAQTTLRQESFETDGEGTRYTSNTFDLRGTPNSSNAQYFVREDNPVTTPTGTPTFGTTNSPCYPTGADGIFFWASEGARGQTVGSPDRSARFVQLNPVTVTSYSALQVKVQLANPRGPGSPLPSLQWDNDDYVRIKVRVNGSTTWTTIGQFVGDSPAGATSGNLRQDTNLNNSSSDNTTAPVLGIALQDFTFNVTGSGTTLEVMVEVDQIGGTEELAFDNIRVVGTPSVTAPPALANIESADLGYTEGDAAKSITNTLTVADPDSPSLTGATVSLTTGYISSQDVLQFTNQTGITGSFSSASGVLTLTGTASLASYQTALRSVKYFNSQTVTAIGGPRVATFVVSDGTNTSNASSRSINVVAVLNPPAALPYTEDFETDGEGLRYASNSWSIANPCFGFLRVSTNPYGCTPTTFTNLSGTSYWYAEGTTTLNNPYPVDIGTLVLAPVNATTAGNLHFNVRLGVGAGTPPGLQWEIDDYVKFSYRVNSGSWVLFGAFFGDGPNNGNSGNLRQDANLDGIADPAGTLLTSALQNIDFAVPAAANGGASVDFMVEVSTDGQEELAMDRIMVTGTAFPTVTTAAASNVAPTSATLGGNVTANGGATITERGVVYVMGTGTPTTTNPKALVATSGIVVGTAFSGTVSGLAAGTQYTVRAYASNAVGTGYGASTTFTTPAPTTVNSITRTTPTAATTNAASVVYTVTFGAAVTGLSTANFDLLAPGLTGATTSLVSGSGTTYTVTVNTGTGNGSLTLRLANATGTLPGISTALPFAGQTYTIDKTAPTVSSVVVPANNTYRTGQALSFTVNFSEAVTVTGTPQLGLTLDTGGSVQASYVSGSGTSALVFSYTVAAGNADANGIAVGTLALNGGTIRDAATNPATLTLSGVPATTGVLVDGIAPVVSSSNRQTPTAATTNAASLTFRVTFSEGVTGVDAADFTLTTTSGSVSSTGKTVTTVTANSVYDVTVTGVNGNGTVRLDLNGSGTGIIDTPGNAISGGYTGGQTYTLDQTAPTVTITSSTAANGTTSSAATFAYAVTFSEVVTGFAQADLAVTGGSISGFSGSGASYTFSVTPASSGTTVVVTFAANVAQDAAGNGNPAATPYSITYQQPVVATAQNVVVNLAANGTATLNASSINNGSTGPGTLTYTIQKIRFGRVPENSALTLTTPNGANFTQISFASYGTPVDGGNGNYRLGSCNAANSVTTAQNAYLGRNSGTMYASNTDVRNTPILGDPCGGTPKFLAVQAAYSANAASLTYACAEANQTNFVLLTVTDGSGNTSTSVASVAVNAPPAATLTSVSPNPATPGTTVTVGGNNLSGLTGLTVKGVTAAISNLTTSGFTFVVPASVTTGTGTIAVVAPCAQTVTSAFTVQAPTITVNPASLPDGTTGVAYSQTLTASGGTAPYRYAITSGALPAGLSLTLAGVLSGTPTVAGTFSFRTTATDAATGSGPYSGFRNYTLTVVNATVAVASVTRLTPSPTATASVSYQVVFSGSVTGLTPNNFTVTTGGTTVGAAVSSVSGSGTTYTVTVGTGTGDGTLRLNVSNATGILPTLTNTPYTAGETYTITKNFGPQPQLTIQGTGGTGGDVTAFVDVVQVLSSGAFFANGLQNGSFETHNALGNGNYGYNPTGASWTFNASSGIAEGGSAFTPITPIPNGIAVGVVQITGQLQQNLAVPTGSSYQVTFQASQRNCCNSQFNQVLNVLLDGVFLGSIQPANNSAYYPFTSATFAVTAPALTATVSTTSASPTSTAPIPFSVSFLQPVGTTFTAADVTVTGGTLTSGSFSGSGAGPYTFMVTPTSAGTVTVSLAADVATDANNTPNAASNAVSVQYQLPSGLSSVSPAAELPGQVVTLTGTGFTSSSIVRFGSTAASVTLVSATTLMVTVPAGLAPGSAPVSVSTGGSTTPALPFTVLAVYDGGTPGTCAAAVPATGSVGDGAWHYLLSPAGQVVAAYRYTGATLGALALDVLRADPAQPVRQDAGNRYYLGRNWHLTDSEGRFDGRTVGLRLYGLNDEQVRLQLADPAAMLATLKATQYSGPNEDCQLANNVASAEHRTLPAPASSPAGTAYFVAELAVADHFSEFYLTSSPTPLPVELTDFTATVAGPAAVRLAWATASEKNSQQFAVERSADGRTFAAIGTVAAAGTSSSARRYELLDAQLPGGATRLYYRLKQIDADGTFSYSPVRTVALTGATPGLSLFPNPTHGGAATLLSAQPGTLVTVCDALGRPVATATADATGTAALALPRGLATGVYVVRAGSKALRLTVE